MVLGTVISTPTNKSRRIHINITGYVCQRQIYLFVLSFVLQYHLWQRIFAVVLSGISYQTKKYPDGWDFISSIQYDRNPEKLIEWVLFLVENYGKYLHGTLKNIQRWQINNGTDHAKVWNRSWGII